MSKSPLSEYLAEIGARGGAAKHPGKGTGALTPEERTRRAKEAAAARWAGKKTKAKASK